MSFPTVTRQNALLNPVAFPSIKAALEQNAKLTSTVSTSITSSTPSAVILQSLNALSALTGVGEAPFTSSFQASLQADTALSSLLKTLNLAEVAPATAVQDAPPLASLLLQALNSEDLPTISGEIPFLAPYQLGLQAIAALTPQAQTPSQASLAPTATIQAGAALSQDLAAAASPDLLQTLNPLATLAGTADALNLGGADPTASTLFQSHLGALAANPLLASASLNAALTEAPATLRVMETYAGAATSAFSEGQPLNPNAYVLASAGPEELSPNPSPSAMSVEGIAAVYSPQGVSATSRTRLGALLDVQV